MTDNMEKRILPNELLLGEVARLVSEGEKVTLMTKGVSMLPFIVGGKDSVILEKPSELEVGMIALAEIHKGVYVLHRIISIEGDKVTLMGDGNIRGCEFCRVDNIAAVASFILKKNGKSIDCSSRRHQRQARIWKRLLPVRRWILAVYRRLFI